MAITPASLLIRPQRRADYPLAVTFKDSAGAAINLTGWTVVAQMWDKARTSKVGDFTVTVTSAVNGQVELKLPYTVTVNMSASEYYYDVMLINPSGTLREYYLEGIARPSEGYSAPA
jgi:NAD dependent epimerase/dehydratase family enzyme